MTIAHSGPANPPNAASGSLTDERPWQLLAGLDAETGKFPARANLDGETVVIFRTNTGFRGTQRNCPHMQATMLLGQLTANDTMVRCPLHVFTFRLSDGRGVNCPGFRIKIFEIKQEMNALYGRPAT